MLCCFFRMLVKITCYWWKKLKVILFWKWGAALKRYHQCIWTLFKGTLLVLSVWAENSRLTALNVFSVEVKATVQHFAAAAPQSATVSMSRVHCESPSQRHKSGHDAECDQVDEGCVDLYGSADWRGGGLKTQSHKHAELLFITPPHWLTEQEISSEVWMFLLYSRNLGTVSFFLTETCWLTSRLKSAQFKWTCC